MKSWKSLVLGVAVLGLSTAAVAQHGMHGGQVHYNPATEVTLSGTVDEVKHMTQGKGQGGLHLILNTQPGPMEVILGPAGFVSSRNFTFAKGDALTVTGSKMTMNATEVLVAREVKRGDEVLTLRDTKGFPLWAGRGRSS
jgi:hypothetical protein